MLWRCKKLPQFNVQVKESLIASTLSFSFKVCNAWERLATAICFAL
ncbi:MAG: hypothetical protein ACJAXH_001391 [Colwellia sp.]|jgi:hypothetical protein